MEREIASEKFAPVFLEEAEIAVLARSRTPEAWTTIYNTHQPAIFRYVRARVFNNDTAEDLTADVFVNALKSIGTYRYRGKPLLAWLYSIARNIVAGYQRQLLGRNRKSAAVPFGFLGRFLHGGEHWNDPSFFQRASDGADGQTDPASVVENIDLYNAIAQLPEAQRETVLLRFFVGLGTQQVAQVMSKTPSAVYSLQARALLALRDRLQHEEYAHLAQAAGSPASCKDGDGGETR